MLCLHVDTDKKVWVAAGTGGLPAATGLTPGQFLAEGRWLRLVAQTPGRLLAASDNAELIMTWSQCSAQPLWLASPCLIAARETPASVLAALQQPASRGLPGLRRCGEWERVTYALAVVLADQRPADLRALLSLHPTWPALTLVPDVDWSAAAQLLVAILDPRWFRHERRPHRLSRLEAFLGLRSSRPVTPAAGERSRLVYATWRRGAQSLPLTHPRNFLARIAARSGFQAAGRRLVRLLTEVWLAVLAGRPEAAFAPERFFKSPAEMEAYREALLTA